MFKRLLRSVSVVLTLALVFSIVTCAPFSASETDDLAATSAEASFGELSEGMYTLESTTYRLTDDFAAEGYIYVPSDVEAEIDLNGHTLRRDLAEASSTGYVILNDGTLTVSDSGASGRITGGKAMNGGAIYTTGALTVSGGDISGNTATNSAGAIRIFGGTAAITGGTIAYNEALNYHGGAIYASDCTLAISGGSITDNSAKDEGGAILNGTGSVLEMTGGTVTGNASAQGGGICVRSDSTLNMSGAPVITNNTAATPNLYLSTSDTKINVIGKFYAGAQIDVSGVVSSNNGDKRVVTNGFGAYGNGTTHAAFFTFGGGANAVVEDGEIKAVTDLGTAVGSWADLQAAIDNAADGDKITLSQDLTAGASDSNISVASDKNITLNLNGKTLNGYRDTESSVALSVYGTLTVIDTKGGGNITGGQNGAVSSDRAVRSICEAVIYPATTPIAAVYITPEAM